MQKRYRSAAERFDAFADKSGGPDACWPWTAHVSPNRYGIITLDDGTKTQPHRYAQERFNGPIPEGMVVRHRCDNKPCVNPAHLLIGTKADNSRDAYERGLVPRGSDHHFARLTEADIPVIRAKLREGVSESRIAAMFGVSRGAINNIRRGNSWAHIEDAA